MGKFFNPSKKKKPEKIVDNLVVLFEGLKKKKDTDAILKKIQDHTLLLQEYFTDGTSSKEAIVNKFVQNGLVLEYIQNLETLEFETRKSFVILFSNFSSFASKDSDSEDRTPKYPVFIDYLTKHTEIIDILFSKYSKREVALNCGMMIRDCIPHKELARYIFYSDNFNRFYELLEIPVFDICSDTILTFKELLVGQSDLALGFMTENFDSFFKEYRKLLTSNTYAVKVESLKILGEILLNRKNFKIMLKYVDDPENLKLSMNLMNDMSKKIQKEAFHIFKIFVANPKKSPAIKKILDMNKKKLLIFMENFNPDKDDEDFLEEKEIIIEKIKKL